MPTQSPHQRVLPPCHLPPRSQVFVSCFHGSSVGRHGWGLTSSTDLIRPRGDDQTTRIPMTSRPIIAQLVLDKVNPCAHPEQPSPTTATPTSPTHRRRESDPGRGPLPSEAVVPWTQRIVTTIRHGSTSVTDAGNGLTARAALRFITTPIPENAVSIISNPFPLS
jgi:hypothetical protein